jgi:hypothetical protein
MTTAIEFAKGGITGQTFREITEKFGKPFNRIGEDDPVMGNYALAFAWFREREHLALPAAYDKAMTLTTDGVLALFEDVDVPEVKAAADFVSPPLTTTP